MKFGVLAMIAAVLASSCGRYEGIPEPAFHSTLDIDWDETPTRDEPEDHPAERTLRVTIRDVDHVDVYDENCRLLAPPSADREWFDKFGQKLEIFPAGTELADASTFDLPINAREMRDGCEAPGVLVRLPYAEEYTARVIDEMCCGLFNPDKPFYPHTFHVPWMGPDVPTPTLILFE